MTGPSSERTADAEALARLFHETYERLAPEYGYKPREETSVPWDDVPDPNRSLMIAVAGEVRDRLVARNQQLQEALEALLEWAEKDKGGYPFSNPSEEWYAIRDYARAALASVRARTP